VIKRILENLLEAIFPPKLGKIEGVDDVLRLHGLREGMFTLVPPEPKDSGIGRVWEWPGGRWDKPRRIR
jgi:hypothetical protein